MDQSDCLVVTESKKLSKRSCRSTFSYIKGSNRKIDTVRTRPGSQSKAEPRLELGVRRIRMESGNRIRTENDIP
ncbi:hypothetical protein EVAR_8589_1 [Eumeta japonica]|uniref:Uncharacterized protein n=1 Tax=Eumeta variegata TaxID=151549 RepID=A0A4C2AAV6_EUMVA|nr:hypothetical protein EVAR_8589_1 [Eumeta japonica]